MGLSDAFIVWFVINSHVDLYIFTPVPGIMLADKALNQTGCALSHNLQDCYIELYEIISSRKHAYIILTPLYPTFI